MKGKRKENENDHQGEERKGMDKKKPSSKETVSREKYYFRWKKTEE